MNQKKTNSKWMEQQMVVKSQHQHDESKNQDKWRLSSANHHFQTKKVGKIQWKRESSENEREKDQLEENKMKRKRRKQFEERREIKTSRILEERDTSGK
jgi:hypothetical protein